MEMDISGKSEGEISIQDQNDPVQVDKSRPTPIPRKSVKKPNLEKRQVPYLEELRGKLQTPAKPKPPVMPKPLHLVKSLPVSSDNGGSETSEMKSPTAALAPDKTTMSSKALKEVPLLTSSSTSPSSCSSSSESEMAKKVVNRKNMCESSLYFSEIQSLSNKTRAVPEEQNVKHGTSKSADAAEKSQPESTLSFRDKLKLFNKCGNYDENHSGLEGGNKFERDVSRKGSVKAKLSDTSIWGKVSTQSEVTSYHYTATATSQDTPALKALTMPLKDAATEAPAREMANEGVAVAQGSSVPVSRESSGNERYEAADKDYDVGLKEFVLDDSTEEWNNENFSLQLDTQTSTVLYQNLCEQERTHNPCTEWIDSPFDYVSSIDFIQNLEEKMGCPGERTYLNVCHMGVHHKSDNSDNTELKYDDELPYDKYSGGISLLGVPFSPQDFGSEMLGYSNARGRQSDLLEKEWLKQENEKLKKENETLKKQTTIQVPVRPYRLRLLKTLATECRICKVTLFLQEGMVEFHGLEEDCESARWTFLTFLQDLAEDSLQISTSISSILQSESGRCFMENLCKLHPACSLETEDDCVKCAAVKMRDVQTCLDDLRRKICQKTCKVQSKDQSNPKFSPMKVWLEKDLLVRLTANVLLEEVVVEGIGVDVDNVCKELELFNNYCQRSEKYFQINGSLQTRACKLWFNQELEQIKQAIRKEGGEIISDDTTTTSYTLTYHCQQSQCAEIDKRLDAVRDALAFTTFDLTSYFSTYTERALVIHGLHQIGVEQFCLLQENSFTKKGVKCVLSIMVPSKCTLPKHRIYSRQTRRPYKSRGRHTADHKNHPPPQSEELNKSFTVTPGNTTITVKTGDITEEQTDVLVNVVGEDLNMSFTAVGAAILRKCRSAGQLLQHASGNAVLSGESEVIVTPIPHSDQPGSSTLKTTCLIHVIIRTWSPDIVASKIKSLVNTCLRETTNIHKSTIVFPPLGSGRRFRLPEDVVASAMITSAMEFIQNYPHAMNNIIFVSYEAKMSAIFIRCLEEWNNKMDITKQFSVMDVADTDEDDVELNFIDPKEDTNSNSHTTSPEFDKFEMSVCNRSQLELSYILDEVKKELKKTFVWQERAKDWNALQKLHPSAWAEIEKMATKNGVVLNTIKKDGVHWELQVRGQRLGVTQVMAVIKDKLLEKLQDGSHRERRQSHRFPRYWKIFQRGQCEDADDFHSKGVESEKLQPLDGDERAAIELLIQATWDAHFVGAGKDGVNLSHNNIQVLKIERLENPELWDRYCDGRKLLIRRLKKSSSDQKSFTPVGNIAPNGPVRTSVLPMDSLLRRDIIETVNECYLFHGFKIESKGILTKDGLDFRVASDGAMLGKGVYAAESATKADQYADPKQGRTSGNKAMILMRVLLGEPYINTTLKDPPKLARPPCKGCYCDKCTCSDSSHFDSVIDDAGRNFREFVVYDRNLCYPEYFITYQRV